MRRAIVVRGPDGVDERVPATLERAGDEVETAADRAAAAEVTHAGGEAPLVAIDARGSPPWRSRRRGDAGAEARLHAAITLAATLIAPLAERRRTTVRVRVLERPRADLSIPERAEESVIRGLCDLLEDLPDEAGPTTLWLTLRGAALELSLRDEGGAELAARRLERLFDSEVGALRGRRRRLRPVIGDVRREGSDEALDLVARRDEVEARASSTRPAPMTARHLVTVE